MIVAFNVRPAGPFRATRLLLAVLAPVSFRPSQDEPCGSRIGANEVMRRVQKINRDRRG